MTGSSLSEEIVNLLKLMKFENLLEIPSMRMLRKRLKKLAVEKHPDKGGSNEEFKELYQAYEALGNIIATEPENKEDDEEVEARRMFQEENVEEINSACITLRVNSEGGDVWDKILKENFGTPVKNSEVYAENKGEKYTTTFKHEGESCKIYITIYRPSKSFQTRRTILIQAERSK